MAAAAPKILHAIENTQPSIAFTKEINEFGINTRIVNTRIKGAAAYIGKSNQDRFLIGDFTPWMAKYFDGLTKEKRSEFLRILAAVMQSKTKGKKDGACVAFTYVSKNGVVSGFNNGDTEAYIRKNRKINQLSKIQNSGEKSEHTRARKRSEDPTICMSDNGTLQVTNSIGDRKCDPLGLDHEPNVFEEETIDPKKDQVFGYTDGIKDMFVGTGEDKDKVIRECVESFFKKDITTTLVNYCYSPDINGFHNYDDATAVEIKSGFYLLVDGHGEELVDKDGKIQHAPVADALVNGLDSYLLETVAIMELRSKLEKGSINDLDPDSANTLFVSLMRFPDAVPEDVIKDLFFAVFKNFDQSTIYDSLIKAVASGFIFKLTNAEIDNALGKTNIGEVNAAAILKHALSYFKALGSLEKNDDVAILPILREFLKTAPDPLFFINCNYGVFKHDELSKNLEVSGVFKEVLYAFKYKLFYNSERSRSDWIITEEDINSEKYNSVEFFANSGNKIGNMSSLQLQAFSRAYKLYRALKNGSDFVAIQAILSTEKEKLNCFDYVDSRILVKLLDENGTLDVANKKEILKACLINKFFARNMICDSLQICSLITTEFEASLRSRLGKEIFSAADVDKICDEFLLSHLNDKSWEEQPKFRESVKKALITAKLLMPSEAEKYDPNRTIVNPKKSDVPVVAAAGAVAAKPFATTVETAASSDIQPNKLLMDMVKRVATGVDARPVETASSTGMVGSSGEVLGAFNHAAPAPSAAASTLVTADAVVSSAAAKSFEDITYTDCYNSLINRPKDIKDLKNLFLLEVPQELSDSQQDLFTEAFARYLSRDLTPQWITINNSKYLVVLYDNDDQFDSILKLLNHLTIPLEKTFKFKTFSSCHDELIKAPIVMPSGKIEGRRSNPWGFWTQNNKVEVFSPASAKEPATAAVPK